MATTDLVRRVTWDRSKKNKKTMPEFRAGDSIGVYVKVKEGEKERVQLFAGVVIKMQGRGSDKSFTVRKIASGVGVERTFPVLSPSIDRIEVLSRGKIRRSRLFYLRGLKGRSARLDSELYYGKKESVGAADEIAAPVAEGSAEAAASEEKPTAAPDKKAEKASPKADKAE